jgi:hypothetical protein
MITGLFRLGERVSGHSVRSQRHRVVLHNPEWENAVPDYVGHVQSWVNGSCTTANQMVASQWTEYEDMTTASTPIARACRSGRD